MAVVGRVALFTAAESLLELSEQTAEVADVLKVVADEVGELLDRIDRCSCRFDRAPRLAVTMTTYATGCGSATPGPGGLREVRRAWFENRI